jgi:adenosylhomocysteine nucleosidase
MRIGFVCGLADERRIIQHLPGDVLSAVSGARAAQAKARAAELVAGRAQALVSFGLAGGLDPALRAGDLVVSAHVTAADATVRGDAVWAERVRARLTTDVAHAGAVLGETTVMSSPGTKAQAFARTGARAVDMESVAVARAAEAAGLPFIVVRAIADTAAHSVPAYTAAAIDDEGRTQIGAVLRGAVANPMSLVTLWTLATASRAAYATLRSVATLIGTPER